MSSGRDGLWILEIVTWTGGYFQLFMALIMVEENLIFS